MKHHHFAQYLPSHWIEYLERRNGLSASDFGSRMVELDFEDGSHVVFNYAFCVQDAQRKELAVFTEHCGYHVFSTRGLSWRCADRAPTERADET
jgi:hypothetical protein